MKKNLEVLLYKYAKSKDLKETGSDVLVDLGAGAVAGAASGLAVAPLSTVADMAGTNAKDPASALYGKSYKQISKILYNEGIAKERLKTTNPKYIPKLETYLKANKNKTAIDYIKSLEAGGTKVNDISRSKKIFSGLKEFYGGQSLKALKIAPQNALNFSIFGALAGLGHNLLKDKNKK